MKRALAMALGAVMVAGSAAPAAAASQIDFSGFYRVYFLNDMNLNKNSKDSADRRMTDSYWGHRLNIDLAFRATDEISVHWRLRGPSFKRFGGVKSSDNDGDGRTSVVTHHIYGQIDQDWGTFRVGQIDDGFDSYGLGSLGYAPSSNPMWAFVSPFDAGGRIDGVRFNNKWDNGFGVMAQYQKVSNGSESGDSMPKNRWSDNDYDRYRLEGTYEWDGGGAALGFRYDRDATLWGTSEAQRRTDKKGNLGEYKGDAWFVNPAIMHSWGDFSVHFEGQAGWGRTRELVASKNVVGDIDRDKIKESGYGFFLDFDYNYGPGNVNLAGWWVSGTSMDKDKSRSLVDIAEGNFYPLVVAFNLDSSGWGRESNHVVARANDATHLLANVNGASTFLNNSTFDGAKFFNSSSLKKVNDWNEGASNHWAINFSGNHAFTDDITMHYAVAYLGLNKPNYRVVDSAVNIYESDTFSYKDQKKDLGVEIDLGFTFQLLDNLSFNTTFGYMFSGDAYKTLRGYDLGLDNISANAVWDDADDSYVWYNTLTFSF